MATAMRAAGNEEGDGEGGESDGDTYKEGDGGGEGGESDGNGNKEGNGEEEGEGPHSSSSSDRLPPRHMLPLLL